MIPSAQDTRRLEETARSAAAAGDPGAALAAYRSLLGELHHPDRVYDKWVADLAAVAEAAGQPAVAAVAREYLLDAEGAQAVWRDAGRPADAARCLLRAGHPADAAEAYASVGAYARAAAAYERAGTRRAAARAWRRAAEGFEAAGDDYRTALCLLNEALLENDDGADAESRHRLARAIVLLEEEADRAETAGEGRRALACYHTLIHLGRRTGTHENLAEGFLNCIRYMRDRDHRFLALQYFHDFAEASLAMGEPQAAAEVLREAAAYCRRTGMLYTDTFLARAAEAFTATAEAHLAAGAAPELAENALLAAVDCHNRRGDAAGVKAAYERLAALPLGDGPRKRYARLAERAAEGPERVPAWPFTGYFADATAYPDTWRTDATDADGGADPLSPIPGAVGDAQLWGVVRRRCLCICLEREATGSDGAARLSRIASLGRLGSPLALPPLTRTFDDPDPGIRAAVATALRFLPFRGSLELVDRAVDDPAEPVRAAAVGALRYLAFPGAFEPLIRLYRDHAGLQVRREVLLALGRLVGMDRSAPSRDALEFLLHTLRDGVDPALADDLQVAIAANVSEAALPIVERHLAAEPPGPIQRFLERVSVRLETRRITRTLGGAP